MTVDIEVRWPLGSVESHKGVKSNQLVTLTEGSTEIHAEKLTPAAKAARRVAE